MDKLSSTGRSGGTPTAASEQADRAELLTQLDEMTALMKQERQDKLLLEQVGVRGVAAILQSYSQGVTSIWGYSHPPPPAGW